MKIEGFEEYEVDADGNVSRNGYKLKPQLNSNGYYRIYLSKNGKVTKKYIHRLVAKMFIPNPNDLPQVNHKDGNKLNNRAENLEWVTPKENIQHAFKKGLSKIPCGENNYHYGKYGSQTPYHKKVYQYDENDNLIKKWDSLSDAARYFKKSVSSISSCCKGKLKKVGGYNWSYEEKKTFKKVG